MPSANPVEAVFLNELPESLHPLYHTTIKTLLSGTQAAIAKAEGHTEVGQAMTKLFKAEAEAAKVQAEAAKVQAETEKVEAKAIIKSRSRACSLDVQSKGGGRRSGAQGKAGSREGKWKSLVFNPFFPDACIPIG